MRTSLQVAESHGQGELVFHFPARGVGAAEEVQILRVCSYTASARRSASSKAFSLRGSCQGPGYLIAVSSPKLTTARSAKLTAAGSAKLT